MAVTQYIGARYVPLFAEPIDWDITRAYEPLTIVYYQGNSYTSRQSVPTGIDVTNTTYWALTGNYNAQIEQYRREVDAHDSRITANAQAIADEVTARMSEDTAIRALITTLTNDLKTADTQIRADFAAADTQIRADFAAADTQIRADFAAADTQLSNRIDVIEDSGPINVLTRGVVNDGSEDVSSVINTLTAEGPLYFPSGKYRIDNPVYIKNSICGDGYNKLWANNGTQFISNISTVSTQTGVVNVTDVSSEINSFYIKGISIKCNSNEDGILLKTQQRPLNIFISECSVYNCTGNGYHVEPSASDSRFTQIVNCSAWHNWNTLDGYDYNHRGFYIGGTAPDCKISGCEAMGFFIGFMFDGFTMAENCHAWCGGSKTLKDNIASWRDSIAFVCNVDCILSDVYPDTAYVGVIGNKGANISINNVYYYYDNTIENYDVHLTPMFVSQTSTMTIDGGIVTDRLGILNAFANNANITCNNVVTKTNEDFTAHPGISCNDTNDYFINAGTSWTEIAAIGFTDNGDANLIIANTGGWESLIHIKLNNSAVTKATEMHFGTVGMNIRYKLDGNVVKVLAKSETNLHVKQISKSYRVFVMNYKLTRNVDNTPKSQSTYADDEVSTFDSITLSS